MDIYKTARNTAIGLCVAAFVGGLSLMVGASKIGKLGPHTVALMQHVGKISALSGASSLVVVLGVQKCYRAWQEKKVTNSFSD